MVARQEEGQRHSESTHACEVVHVQNFLGVIQSVQIKRCRERERKRERLLLGYANPHCNAKGRIVSSPTENDKNLEKVVENFIICIKPIGNANSSFQILMFFLKEGTDVELSKLLYYSMVKIAFF
jgi:hypothetical protein